MLTEGVGVDRIESIVFTPMPASLRNHLVTLAYSDLSDAMAEFVGPENANWCTLAVWPSFTVGHPIRAEQDPWRLSEVLDRMRVPHGRFRAALSRRLMRGRLADSTVVNRGLAAGNRGVFLEIGRLYADFLTTVAAAAPSDRPAAFTAFEARLRRRPAPPGGLWPPPGEHDDDRLAEGFASYVEAAACEDPTRRAQLVLRANLLLGEHEQRRLQPWLEVSLLEPMRVARRPAGIRLPVPDAVLAAVEQLVLEVTTRYALQLQMGDEVVRLGLDLGPPPGAASLYPPGLRDLTDPGLIDVVARLGAGADPEGRTAARIWTELGDRMWFIAELFRSRQQCGLVGRSPYNDVQLQHIQRDAEKVEAELVKATRLARELTSAPAEDWLADLERRLPALRAQGDPVADDAVAAFYEESGVPPAERHFAQVMSQLRADNGSPGAAIGQFLHAPAELPPWADRAKLELARQFFDDWRVLIDMALAFGSLPACYAAADGVEVLGLVSALNNDPQRRVWETTALLEDVMTTDVVDPGRPAYRSVRGVRLFHAAVRHMVLQRAEGQEPLWDWDPARGLPVNQEDLFGTLLAFNVVVLDVLEKVGVPLEPDGAEAYLHAWFVAGYLLGVDPTLLVRPDGKDQVRTLDRAEASAALALVQARQFRPSAAGQHLTEVLLGMYADWFPRPFRSLPPALVRRALGGHVADMLGVPPAPFTVRALRSVSWLGRRIGRHEQATALLRTLMETAGDGFLRYYAEVFRDRPPWRFGGPPPASTLAPG